MKNVFLVFLLLFLSTFIIAQNADINILKDINVGCNKNLDEKFRACLVYQKWYVIAPSYIWACWGGYSRMHLGAHYPSDVLAGAIIGSRSSFLFYIVNQWFHKRKG